MTDSPITAIATGLAEFFKDDPAKIAFWLLTDNPHFGNMSPSDLIAIRGEAGIQKVAKFVVAAMEENRPE